MVSKFVKLNLKRHFKYFQVLSNLRPKTELDIDLTTIMLCRTIEIFDSTHEKK